MSCGTLPAVQGSRFIKTLEKMELTFDFTYLQAYFSGREKRTLCHPCAYGAVCACAGVALKDALLNYLYAQASAMVTNCVKLIPLSQSEGQRILADLYPLFEEILSLVREAGLEMLCVSAPPSICAASSMRLCIPGSTCPESESSF